MKTLFSTIAVLVLLGLGGATVVIYLGIYDVGAADHHWAPTRWLLETARVRSIKVHAASIVPPANLNDGSRVIAGTAHFDEDCSACHAPPGGKAKDLVEGMYPEPPPLKNVSARLSPSEIFWVLKNGIKMSGMPSWADHSDDELWNIVAFTEKLPDMSPETYWALVKASTAAGSMKMR